MLESWTGSYDRESEAAALFELLLFHFARAYYRPSVLGAYAATWALRDLISRDVAAAPPEALGKIVVGSLKRAVRRRRGRKWGELHRLRLEHPLAAVPLAGRRYRFLDAAADGGSETLLKTANPLISGRHAVRFGSNARFVTDLSGLDENHFVLLGGQDGWFGSVNFLDQVPIWQRGEYMRVPLSPDGVRKALPYAVALSPRGKPAA
jgi:penicillin G amidase